MKYQKLSVFLSGELSKSEPGSTNAIITECLLKHIGNEDDISVQSIAEECHVGIGTVSRYVKNTGFYGFSELRNLLKEVNTGYEYIENVYDNLSHYHTLAVREVVESISVEKIQQLAKEIQKTEKVSIFGLFKGQSAAISLTTDLLALGKMTYTAVSPNDQIETIFHSDKDELIVLFSVTCSYFDYFDIRNKQSFLTNRNIWMIGSGMCPEFINNVIVYQSTDIPLSHPLQLLCIAEMLAQEYAKLVMKNATL